MPIAGKLVLFAAVASFAVVAPPAAAEDVAATIRAGTEKWVKAFNAGDANTLVALYAENAVVMPPGSPSLKGHVQLRQAMTKEIAGAQSAGISFAFGTMNDVGVAGNTAWHAGTYLLKDKAGATVDTGKYVELWQKSGGRWLMIRNIWNSDTPAPDPAPSPAKPAAAAPK